MEFFCLQHCYRPQIDRCVWNPLRSVQMDGGSLPPPNCTKESSQYIRAIPRCPAGAIWRQILSLIYHSNASRALMSVEKTLGFAPFNKWIKAAWSMWWHLPKMTRTILGKIVFDKIIVSNKADGPSDTTEEELLQPDNSISLLETDIFHL